MEQSEFIIWGYQYHFQNDAKRDVQRLCKVLDPSLHANVFMVGLQREENEALPDVCLVPSDSGHRAHEFSGVLESATNFESTDPRSQIFHSHPVAQARQMQKLKADSLRKSLLHHLNRWQLDEESMFFCAHFMGVNGYLVSMVVQLTRTGDSSEHRLPKVHVELGSSAPKSLLEAAIEEILYDATRALDVPDPTQVSHLSSRSTGELLRAAGRAMMYAPVMATRNYEGVYELFDACNGISSQRYEGAESLGNLIVSRRNHPNVRKLIALREPVRLANHRAARKLLETSTAENSLLSDGFEIYGLGSVKGIYDQGLADLFAVRFVQHHTWELMHDEHRMMIVRYGEPRLPLQVIDENKFRSDVGRIFSEAPKVEKLLGLANMACRQRHGTILIISRDANTEATRLSRQGTSIEPTELTEELLESVSSIDGAVLIDPQCVCYGIGVILDGVATPDGDSGRGARYNSCIRYLAGKKECLALIVSEDGSVEWLPNLRPQILREVLAKKSKEIDDLLAVNAGAMDATITSLTWLRENEFYLSAEMCDKGNALQNRYIEERKKAGEMYVQYTGFKPHPAMNDEYLV